MADPGDDVTLTEAEHALYDQFYEAVELAIGRQVTWNSQFLLLRIEEALTLIVAARVASLTADRDRLAAQIDAVRDEVIAVIAEGVWGGGGSVRQVDYDRIAELYDDAVSNVAAVTAPTEE